MLPTLSFATAPEDYALSPPISAADCDTAAGVATEKPGVVAFRSLVMATLGGGDFGITRPCNVGGPSDHKTGRAWDWKLDASNPADAALAQALFDWLFAMDGHGNEEAMLRRAGITFLIWNRQMWSTKTGRVWAPYTGPNPHTDHVHVSFGWPGALAQTSLYGALGVEPAEVALLPGPPSTPSGVPAVVVASTLSTDLLGLAAGAVAGFLAITWWLRR